MEWFILTAVIALLTLAVTITLRTKRHDAGSIQGHFDFANFKDRELSKRGVYDRTEWWK